MLLGELVKSMRRPVIRPQILPLIVVVGWWLLTLLSFQIGWPLSYIKTNSGLVLILVLCTATLTVIAYIGTLQMTAVARKDLRHDLVPKWGALVGLALLPLSVAVYTRYSIWDLPYALLHQGESYEGGLLVASEGSEGRLPFLGVSILLSPIVLTSVPYFAYRWFRDRSYPYWLFASALPLALFSFYVGRDQSIGLLLSLVIAAWLASAGSSQAAKERVQNLLLVIAVVIVFAVQSALRKLDRVGDLITSPSVAPEANVGPSAASPTPTIGLPEPTCVTWPGTLTCLNDQESGLLAGARMVASYATQGYEGLGHALEATWRFSGGYGHSPAVTNALQTLGVVSKGDATCAGAVGDQLECLGWSSDGLWSTAFTQLANDVPWILVPLVVAVMGMLLAMSRSAITSEASFLPVSVFAYTFVGLVWMPMNFQLGASGSIYIGYIALVVAFLTTTRLGRNDNQFSLPGKTRHAGR